MEGRPVWLASLSMWSRGKVMPTGVWCADSRLLASGTAILGREVLAGVGDTSRERLFRMNVTLCMHRGLTVEEEATIGPGKAIHLAGAPIEVMWERGVRGSPAAQPCESPTRKSLSATDERLWLPIDCGQCEPCKARLAIEAAVA